MVGFQNKVNIGPARGWHGDFASTNARVSVFNGGAFNEDAYAAGASGVQAGSFVWYDEETRTLSNKGTGSPDGFVAREQTGIMTQYLQEYSMRIPQGFMVTAYAKGEFLVALADDIGSVKRKDSVYVDPNTGLIVDASEEGAVETGYKYAESGNGGDLVVISAWI